MPRARISGDKQILGTHGYLWWNGEIIFEVEAVEAKTTANREDVIMSGSLDEDSKITSLTGKGMFRVKKVFTRGEKALVEAWNRGEDPRSQLVTALKDPSAYGYERVSIGDVAFDEVTVAEFELKKLLTREFPFRYLASSVKYLDEIPVR